MLSRIRIVSNLVHFFLFIIRNWGPGLALLHLYARIINEYLAFRGWRWRWNHRSRGAVNSWGWEVGIDAGTSQQPALLSVRRHVVPIKQSREIQKVGAEFLLNTCKVGKHEYWRYSNKQLLVTWRVIWVNCLPYHEWSRDLLWKCTKLSALSHIDCLF